MLKKLIGPIRGYSSASDNHMFKVPAFEITSGDIALAVISTVFLIVCLDTMNRCICSLWYRVSSEVQSMSQAFYRACNSLENIRGDMCLINYNLGQMQSEAKRFNNHLESWNWLSTISSSETASYWKNLAVYYLGCVTPSLIKLCLPYCSSFLSPQTTFMCRPQSSTNADCAFSLFPSSHNPTTDTCADICPDSSCNEDHCNSETPCPCGPDCPCGDDCPCGPGCSCGCKEVCDDCLHAQAVELKEAQEKALSNSEATPAADHDCTDKSFNGFLNVLLEQFKNLNIDKVNSGSHKKSKSRKEHTDREDCSNECTGRTDRTDRTDCTDRTDGTDRTDRKERKTGKRYRLLRRTRPNCNRNPVNVEDRNHSELFTRLMGQFMDKIQLSDTKSCTRHDIRHRATSSQETKNNHHACMQELVKNASKKNFSKCMDELKSRNQSDCSLLEQEDKTIKEQDSGIRIDVVENDSSSSLSNGIAVPITDYTKKTGKPKCSDTNDSSK